MKKILLVLLLLITFTLSGCEPSEEQWADMTDFEKTKYCQHSEHEIEARCTIWNNIEEPTYYTQEEVDELLLEQANTLIELQDAYKLLLELQFSERINELEFEIESLKEDVCDTDCEILITTIGLIDILIYQYENSTEEMTVEDENAYNLLLIQRQQLLGEIE